MELPLVDFQGNMLSPRDNTLLHESSFPHGSMSFEGFHGGKSLLNRNVSNLEEHEILTSCGIHQRVYVQQSPCKRALITYHDIGTNHISFLGFFNHPEMLVITKHFTVYHICAPGHHENAKNENFDINRFTRRSSRRIMSGSFHGSDDQSNLIGDKAVDLQNRRSSGTTGTVASYPSLDQLAQMLTSILVHFGIDCFVGFGMGAGSNVLARYALHYPNKILGLFLLNPTITSHSYYQRFVFRWWEWSKLEQGCLSDNMLEQLDNHWFGYGLAENEDVVRFYHELAHSLNPANLAGYIRAFVDRVPLNLIRPVLGSGDVLTADGVVEPTVIRAEVCLVTGDRAADLAKNVAEMNGCMDPTCTQFILIPDCTGMVMEENPDKLAIDFLHFLRSVGLVITLTPEKLHEQATALQIRQSSCAHSIESSVAPVRLDLVNEV